MEKVRGSVHTRNRACLNQIVEDKQNDPCKPVQHFRQTQNPSCGNTWTRLGLNMSRTYLTWQESMDCVAHYQGEFVESTQHPSPSDQLILIKVQHFLPPFFQICVFGAVLKRSGRKALAVAVEPNGKGALYCPIMKQTHYHGAKVSRTRLPRSKLLSAKRGPRINSLKLCQKGFLRVEIVCNSILKI